MSESDTDMLRALPKRHQKPAGWLWGQFNNARGHKMRYGTLQTYKAPRAHIVYIEGLSEFAEKTFELSRNFNDMACNFSVLDRYGQGKSDRYMADDPHKQHSDGTSHDVDDIIQYCRDHIPEGQPIILLGFSTGGLLALEALRREPELFDGAMLVAPLLGIKNSLINGRESLCAKLPLPQAVLNRYSPGGHPWQPRNHQDSEFPPEAFSNDPVRRQISDYWTTNNEKLRVGSPTVGWVREMCRAIVKVRAPDFLDAIKQPVLIFTAGDDCLVENAPAQTIAAALENATHTHYPDGKHELLMETDDIRDDLLSKADDFLKNNL